MRDTTPQTLVSPAPMKIALLLLALLFIAIGAMALVGSFLPRAHSASRAANYGKTPAELYAIVRAFERTPEWRPSLKSVELLPPEGNRPRFREHTTDDKITYRVLEDRPGERLVTEIADLGLPYGGTWTFEFTPAARGTTLRITERGEVKNVLFRFLARFVFGHTRTLETYLSDLGRKVGEPVTPAA